MARTTPADLRDELEVSSSKLSDSEAQTHIDRANSIVNERLDPDIDDTSLLTDIETLVAAHLALPDASDTFKGGQRLSQVQQGSRSASFADYDGSTGAPAGGYTSTYWDHALLLDPTGRLGADHESATVISSR